jgi:hypothetical protein
MHRFHLLKIKVSRLYEINSCITHLFHGFDTLGSSLEGRRVPDYDGGFVHLQVHLKINTNIYHQQAPFSGAVAGEQVIKIPSFIAFCVIFSFLLVFLFASTNF